jgi:hypothetical protein
MGKLPRPHPDLRRTVPLLPLLAALPLILLVSGCASPRSTDQPTSTIISTVPSLGPTSTSLPATATQISPQPTRTLLPIPTISVQDWSRGAPDSPVSILVYSDFQ